MAQPIICEPYLRMQGATYYTRMKYANSSRIIAFIHVLHITYLLVCDKLLEYWKLQNLFLGFRLAFAAVSAEQEPQDDGAYNAADDDALFHLYFAS